MRSTKLLAASSIALLSLNVSAIGWTDTVTVGTSATVTDGVQRISGIQETNVTAQIDAMEISSDALGSVCPGCADFNDVTAVLEFDKQSTSTTYLNVLTDIDGESASAFANTSFSAGGLTLSNFGSVGESETNVHTMDTSSTIVNSESNSEVLFYTAGEDSHGHGHSNHGQGHGNAQPVLIGSSNEVVTEAYEITGNITSDTVTNSNTVSAGSSVE